MKAALAALSLATAAPTVAHSIPPWQPVNAETGQIRDVEGLTALSVAFPDSGSVRLRLLQAQIGAEDFQAAIETLRWLGSRGYVFSAGARERIPGLLGEEHAAEAKSLLLQEPVPVFGSTVVAEVPAEAGLIESVHSTDGFSNFVASSITRNGFYLLSPDGEWTEYALGSNDWSGLVFDAKRQALWFASSNIDESPDDDGFVGLVMLPRDMQAVEAISAPAEVTISDIALGPDGTVFASDPLGGGIYKSPSSGTVMETVLAPGTLRSPQGIAVSADNARLYVSDYRYGLAIVDLSRNQISRLESEVPTILDGIDGLWLHEDELIAVQNGTSPMRISAFQLSEDGTRIVGQRVLELANPEWTEPLSGNIVDGALIYIGTGQWDRYVKGEPVADKPPIPTQIRRLPLR